METNGLNIRIETDDPSEASKLARELSDTVRKSAPDVEVKFKRDDPEAQDLGSILHLLPQVQGMVDTLHPFVHGAAFSLETLHAVVAAILIWRERRPRKVLVVETPAGALRIDREAPAAELVEQIHALLSRTQEPKSGDQGSGKRQG